MKEYQDRWNKPLVNPPVTEGEFNENKTNDTAPSEGSTSERGKVEPRHSGFGTPDDTSYLSASDGLFPKHSER